MQALRNIYTVKNHRVVIELPKTFNYNAVEIIVLPIEVEIKIDKKPEKNDKKESLKKLMSLSVWNDKDAQLVIESQKLINQWKIEEF